MAYFIRRAQKEGKPIAVTSETTKKTILQTARIMGVKPPKVIVAPLSNVILPLPGEPLYLIPNSSSIAITGLPI